jgi:hypothetical protein
VAAQTIEGTTKAESIGSALAATEVGKTSLAGSREPAWSV